MQTPQRFGPFVVEPRPTKGSRPHGVSPAPFPDPRVASVLERRYPRVVRTLTLLWGYPELTEYLDRIAAGTDTRLKGIEPAAMAELMVLAELHRTICPRVPRPNVDALHPTGRRSGPWRPVRQRA
jgi:hypothetical protein